MPARAKCLCEMAYLPFLSAGRDGNAAFSLFPFVASAIRCGEKMSLCSVPLWYQQSV